MSLSSIIGLVAFCLLIVLAMLLMRWSDKAEKEERGFPYTRGRDK